MIEMASVHSRQRELTLAQTGRRHRDERVQHELKEMQETRDLREIDDDVEELATLYEWQALEHVHQPKSSRWFLVAAVASALLIGWFIITFNLIAALTTALVGGLVYYFAQREPDMQRCRLMVDGVAINNTLYHYKELASFNIVYEPGQTKVVLLRSKRRFAPLITMEIGDADPVLIRDVLIEFVSEDQDLEEPLTDILARRVGF